jgi:hypothetical protein
VFLSSSVAQKLPATWKSTHTNRFNLFIIDQSSSLFIADCTELPTIFINIMRVKTLVAAFLVLALSIISTTFTFLALRNKSWSTQAYYFDRDGTELGTTQITPVCVLERSPLYRCGLPHVYANGTCVISDCAFYKPYGQNRTSCRSSAEYGRPWSENVLAQGLLGMSLECQEGESRAMLSRAMQLCQFD